MAQHGKKYNAAASSFDGATQHGSTEAVTKVKTLASAKFDETVELSVRLGVDPRKADQMVRGTVALPSGTGTDVRIAVFAASFALSTDKWSLGFQVLGESWFAGRSSDLFCCCW